MRVLLILPILFFLCACNEGGEGKKGGGDKDKQKKEQNKKNEEEKKKNDEQKKNQGKEKGGGEKGAAGATAGGRNDISMELARMKGGAYGGFKGARAERPVSVPEPEKAVAPVTPVGKPLNVDPFGYPINPNARASATFPTGTFTGHEERVDLVDL